MRNHNNGSPEKIVAFLEQCRRESKRLGSEWSPTATETELHIGHNTFNAAVKAKYFKLSGGAYVCTHEKLFTRRNGVRVLYFRTKYMNEMRDKRNAEPHRVIAKRQRSDAGTLRMLNRADAMETTAPKQNQLLFPTDPDTGKIIDAPPPVDNDEPIRYSVDVRRKGVNTYATMNDEQFMDYVKRHELYLEMKRRGWTIMVERTTIFTL